MIVRLREALGNVSGQAEKAIPLGGVDSFGTHARLAGALDHPVLDLIGEFLCLWVQFVIYVAQLDQLVHQFQGLVPVFDAQDTLETYDAPSP